MKFEITSPKILCQLLRNGICTESWSKSWKDMTLNNTECLSVSLLAIVQYKCGTWPKVSSTQWESNKVQINVSRQAPHSIGFTVASFIYVPNLLSLLCE